MAENMEIEQEKKGLLLTVTQEQLQELGKWGITFENSEVLVPDDTPNFEMNTESQHGAGENGMITNVVVPGIIPEVPNTPIISENDTNSQHGGEDGIITNVVVPETIPEDITQVLTPPVTPSYPVPETQSNNSIVPDDEVQISVDYEEPTSYSGKGGNEEVEIYEDDDIQTDGCKSARKHHTGPMVARFITDPHKRQACFFGRKSTMLKNAEFLHKATNAEVYLVIKSPDSKGVFVYDSKKRSYRNCGTQFGKPALPPKAGVSTRTKPNTPVKGTEKRHLKTPPMHIHGLPGKKPKTDNTTMKAAKVNKNTPKANVTKSKTTKPIPRSPPKDVKKANGKTIQTISTPPPTSSKPIPKSSPTDFKIQTRNNTTNSKPPSRNQTEGKSQYNKKLTKLPSKSVTPQAKSSCKVCKIDFDSDEDKQFRKKNGPKKTFWVGCDSKSCDYWGHASCVDLFITPNKKIVDHRFLCPKHKK